MDTPLKTCRVCRQSKGIDQFSLHDNRKPNNYRSECKACRNAAASTKHFSEHGPSKRKPLPPYTGPGKESLQAYGRRYREVRREEVKQIKRTWIAKPKNRAKETAGAARRRAENDNYREWREANQPNVNARAAARAKERRRTDEDYRIGSLIRSRMNDGLRRAVARKSVGSEALLGCTFQQARDHLFSLFTPNMTIEAFMAGKIHIDHKIPCCAFDLTRKSEQCKCFHYSNLQPLWGPNNLAKGGKERSSVEFAKRCAAMQVFDVEVVAAF